MAFFVLAPYRPSLEAATALSTLSPQMPLPRGLIKRHCSAITIYLFTVMLTGEDVRGLRIRNMTPDEERERDHLLDCRNSQI